MSAQNVSAQITKTWYVKDIYSSLTQERRIDNKGSVDPYECKDNADNIILTVNYMKGTWYERRGDLFQNSDDVDYNINDFYVINEAHPSNDGNTDVGESLLPNQGACYSFTPTKDGFILIDGILKYRFGSKKSFYIVSANKGKTSGTSVSGATLIFNNTNIAYDTDKRAYILPANLGTDDYYAQCKLNFPVVKDKVYYVFTKDAEGLVFKSFSYTTAGSYSVDDNTSAPYLHQKVSIPGCTMMFGGWLTAAQDKTAATDQLKTITFENTSGKFTDAWKVCQYRGTLSYIKGTGNPAYRESIGAVGPGTGYDGSAPSQFDDVPCYGTYYKFNPDYDGTLKLQLFNNGGDNDYYPTIPTKWCYFIDEAGTLLAPNSDYTHIIDVNGSWNVEAGSETTTQYVDFDVKAGKTYYLFSDAYEIGFRKFNFTYATSSSNYVTLNQTDSYSQAATNNANIYLNRTYLSGWNTICLPFSMSQDMVRTVFGSDVALETFNVTVPKDNTTEGKTQRIVYFRKHYYQDIVAGVPYLIYLPNGKSLGAVNIPYATIEGVAAKTIYDKASYFNYVGTYSPLDIPSNDYYLASSGSSIFFSRSTKNKGNNMNGFRAYFQSQNGEGGVSDVQNAKAASFGLDDEETTGIIEIENSVTTESKASAVYNINGSKVAESLENANLPKGVYIVNGKKVVLN